MSIKKYKTIDICVFVALACCAELLTGLVNRVIKVEYFSLSVSVLLGLIVAFRWGWYCVLVASLGGLVYCLINNASVLQIAVYVGGNSAIVINLLHFKIKKSQQIKDSVLMSLVYCITGYLIVWIARGIIATIATSDMSIIIALIGSDLLNMVICIGIFMIARRQNGLIENQIDFIIRIQKKEANMENG